MYEEEKPGMFESPGQAIGTTGVLAVLSAPWWIGIVYLIKRVVG